jgi:uncharacterized membrane protein
MKIFGKIFPALMVLGFLWVPAAQAANYTFKTFDVPGAQDTVAFAINNSGLVVGTCGSFTTHVGHGFTYTSGEFATFDAPNASGGTYAYGLNDAGQIVGEDRTDVYHGFLKVGEQYTPLDVPGAQASTSAHGINKAGKIVGKYDYLSDGTTLLITHSFSHLEGGGYATFAVDGATYTEAWGINDAGQIVGRYFDSSYHGFLYDGQSFTYLNFPGGTDTQAYGINNRGQIVGTYTLNGAGHGFILNLNTGKWETLDVPGAEQIMLAGINDIGQIVGGFTENGHYRGFMATPKRGLSAVTELLLLE